ncbi:predicted protein [Histoplasma capsulatum G186AR]|uniref:Uncharacterized protein n=1 Tax=Ajellomyces capsulatus (strain G186AR / H82 / ATCC MYA-2454 / RMSCC 2432) TaxID=447093 RepID=C0NK64_AJECG|nr:uncharacterized protein HCBG_03544 [Histoplasma capsulatum G186AR]EEH08255.1 predicted protein [Histoplasma capsulatum G186AR]
MEPNLKPNALKLGITSASEREEGPQENSPPYSVRKQTNPSDNFQSSQTQLGSGMYLGNFSKDKSHLAPSPPTDLKVFPSEILPKSTYQWRASMDACKRYTEGIPWKFKGTEARVRMSKHSSLVRRGRKAFPPQKVEIQTPPNDPSIRDVPKPDPTEKGTGKFAFCQC